MKISAALTQFSLSLRESGYSKSTLTVYEWFIRELAAWGGDAELDTITDQVLATFLHYLKQDYTSRNGRRLSRSSLENARKALRAFFRWTGREISLPPLDPETEQPARSGKQATPYTRQEVVDLLEACMYTQEYATNQRKPFRTLRPAGFRDKAMVLMLLDTGILTGELCSLNVGNLDLNRSKVLIRPYGTQNKGSNRKIHFGSLTHQALSRYLEQRSHPTPQEPLFASERGGPLNRRGVDHLFQRLGERAGVADVHPQRFRLTFAKLFIDGGGTLQELHQALGHSDTESTMRYWHLFSEDNTALQQTFDLTEKWGLAPPIP